MTVVLAVQRFQTNLYGGPFGEATYHHSFCWLPNYRDPSGRLACWVLPLQEHDFSVSYKSGGGTHNDADWLSRLPLPSSFCRADRDGYLSLMTNTLPNLEHLRHEQREHQSLQPLFRGSEMASEPSTFTLRDGILNKRNMNVDGARWFLVVPRSLQTEIIRAKHDNLMTGHSDFAGTFARVPQQFFCHGMRR